MAGKWNTIKLNQEEQLKKQEMSYEFYEGAIALS